MSTLERHFTVADPRDFDGNPFEVAERAIAQLEGLLVIADDLLPKSELMARNAEMTRRIDLGGDPEGDRWAGEPQGRQWQAVREELSTLKRRLRTLKATAGWDPKDPKNR
jgi:hypothetical protein